MLIVGFGRSPQFNCPRHPGGLRALGSKKYGQSAWDMGGREHDLAELRERRNAAVTKGLRKMFKFFKKGAGVNDRDGLTDNKQGIVVPVGFFDYL